MKQKEENRLRVLFVCVFSFMLLFSAAAHAQDIPSAPDEQPRYGGTLRVAFGDPLAFFPVSFFEQQLVVGNIYNHLIRFEKDWQYEVAPDLAESWTISPDHKTYTFDLVRNATWHDGEPFTSEDVKFSYGTGPEEGPNRAPQTHANFFWNPILESVEAPDDYTVVFNLNRPVPEFEFMVGLSQTFVYPAHIYKGTDWLKNPANQNPIGTGPFKFVEYVKGDHYTFERNPDYFKEGLPYLDRIIGKVIVDPEARIRALENGEVDYAINDVPYADIERIKSNPDLGYAEAGNQGTAWYLIINQRNPILHNKLVRQGIQHAIDTEEIVDKITFGADRAPRGMFNSTTPYYKTDTVLPRYSYDPAKAEQLLDQAGYPVGPNGDRFRLNFVTWNQPDILRESQLVQQRLEDVNINVTLDPVDKNTWISTVFTEPWDYDLVNMGTFPAGGPTPNLFTRWFSDSRFDFSEDGGAPFSNGWAFKNATIDRLWQEADLEFDEDKRMALYGQLQDALAEELPYILLREGNFKHAYNNDFVGIPFVYISWSMMEGAETVWKRGGDGEVANTGTRTVGLLVAGGFLMAVVAGVMALRARRRNQRLAT